MSTETIHMVKKKTPGAEAVEVPALRFKGYEDNWESLNLKKLIKDLASGISVNSEDRPIANDLEFGILKTSAVANGVFRKFENKKIVDEEITRAKLNPTVNEIIISRMNTPQLVGESGYIDKTYPNLFVPDRLWQTVTYAEKCHNRWLSYFLITERVRYNLKSIATGTSGTMKNISKPNFLGIKVNCPSLPEQQKIASFLSAVDEKIRQLTKKAALLEHYKKGVMQQLFSGKLRFKPDGVAGPSRSYPDWEEKRLGNLTTKVGKKNKENIQYPIYSINNQEGFRPQSEQFDGLDSNERGYDISMYKIVHSETFAYNPARINVGSIGYSYNLKEVIISSLYVCFKTKDELEDLYLLAYLDSYNFKKDILRYEEGGVRQYLFYENFSHIKIPLPSVEEQKQISQCLASIQTKIESVNQQITQTQTFKRGLLQKMFV